MLTRLIYAAILCGLLLSPAMAQPNEINLRQDPPPAVQSERVTATYTGAAGATTYYYWIVTRYPIGFTVPTAPVAVGRAASSLGGGNSIALSWPAMAGASSYDVLRTTTPAAPSSCTCAVTLATTSTSVTDNGGGLSAWPPAGLTAAGSAQMLIQINNRDAGAPYIAMAVQNAQRVLNYHLGLLKNGPAPSYVPSGFIQTYANQYGRLACVDSNGADCLGTVANVMDYGATGDGSTDDSPAIQSAVNAVCTSGGTVWFPKPSQFYMIRENGIQIVSCSGVVITSPAYAEIKVASGTPDTRYATWPDIGKNSIFRILSSQKIKISGMVLNQNIQNRTAHVGSESHASCVFISSSSSDVWIDGNLIQNCMTDGIIAVFNSAQGTSTYPRRLWVQNNVVKAARRNNVSLVGIQDAWIKNNLLDAPGSIQGVDPKAGLDIEPESTATSDSITIDSNIFSNSASTTGALIVAGTGTTNSRIVNNVFQSTNFSHGIRLLNQQGYETSNRNISIGPGNIFDGMSNGCGVFINSGAPWVASTLVDAVTSNIFRGNQYGICGYRVDALRVADNQFIGNTFGGVRADNFGRMDLNSNEFVDNASAGCIAAGECFAVKFIPSGSSSLFKAAENYLENTANAAYKQKGLVITASATGIGTGNISKNLNTPNLLLDGVYWIGTGSRVLDGNPQREAFYTQKYRVTKIANGVSGCSNANGCWQVNSGTPVAAAAAASQAITLFVTPDNGINLRWARMKTVSAFTGPATASGALGHSGSVGYYLSGYNLQTAPGITNLAPTDGKLSNYDYPYVQADLIVFNVSTTGGNVDSIADGASVDIWIQWGTWQN